jgi:Mn2+/Fe2+ NRAMP family transporter
VKNLTKVALGILTSIGGFLEAGSISTSLQAGAVFRYSLLWAIALGAICVACLIEMTGRLAAVSHQTVVDAMRKRFGFSVQIWPLAGQILIDLLVLASEIGGAAFALQLATGVPMGFWALPIAALLWIVLWNGKFGQIENGMALLGLVTLTFVAAAWKLGPDWHEAARSLLPHRPPGDAWQYAYLAVSILGASISPYMLTFYSSGAIEEKWKPGDIAPNRIVSGVGMGFGSLVAAAVMCCAAMVLAPMHIKLDSFDEAAGVMAPVFGRIGFWLFVVSLFVGCMGAAFELTLDLGYIVAQTFGWAWGENRHHWTELRFSMAYSIGLFLAMLPALFGVNPFQLTMFSMAVTMLALPLVVAPLLIIMNDERYLRSHTNGVAANTAVALIIALAFLLALVALPVQLMGA